MRRLTKISLSTLNTFFIDFTLMNEHNCRMADVFKVASLSQLCVHDILKKLDICMNSSC